MSKPQILLVDDDAGSLQMLRRTLAETADIRFATNGTDAYRLALELPPDLMLVDAEMPGVNGFDLCAAVKANPRLADIPVIFVTSHAEPRFEVRGLEVGAADFIAKPINPALLQARVKTQLRMKQQGDDLRRLVTVDAITGVANQARFTELLEREWLRLRRTLDPLSLVVVELDHFRAFTQRYGAEAADACLSSVAHALEAACQRPADSVGRLGGAKFALLLPQTPRAGAVCMVGKVMAAIDALSIEHDSSPSALHITASLGLSTYDELSPSWILWPNDLGFAREQNPRLICNASELFNAAEKALVLATLAGGVKAFSLDIADLCSPALAEEVKVPSLLQLEPEPV